MTLFIIKTAGCWSDVSLVNVVVGVVVIVRIFCSAASPIRMGFRAFLLNDVAFLTAGIIIAPEDVLVIEDAVKIREEDKSILNLRV